MEKVPNVLEDLQENFQTNLVGFAGFTVLIWDHIDTFTLEVEHIWAKKKTLITYLFLLNRYLTPLSFIVNLYAYLGPASVWTPDTSKQRCAHFIRYEGAMIVININIVGLMMFLRRPSIRALYYSQIWIHVIVGLLLTIQITIMAYLMTKAERVVHNPASGVNACTMIFAPEISSLASASAWMPLLYDSTIFGLTLNRTLPAIRNKSQSYVIKRLFKDGLLYYSIIFAINAVLTLMIISAPPGLKNITAQLEQLLTVTMMSRITLALKESSSKELRKSNWGLAPTISAFAAARQTFTSTLLFGRQSRPEDTRSSIYTVDDNIELSVIEAESEV
ncbi:hypothetical protein C8J56DRAFT_1168416 [Mycena floridula]|nr:hypothetical protein C8J56DRAFT_1168416 [Mycena floridula]